MTDCPPFFLFLLFFTPFPAVNASTTVTEKKNSTKDDTGKTSQAHLFNLVVNYSEHSTGLAVAGGYIFPAVSTEVLLG